MGGNNKGTFETTRATPRAPSYLDTEHSYDDHHCMSDDSMDDDVFKQNYFDDEIGYDKNMNKVSLTAKAPHVELTDAEAELIESKNALRLKNLKNLKNMKQEFADLTVTKAAC